MLREKCDANLVVTANIRHFALEPLVSEFFFYGKPEKEETSRNMSDSESAKRNMPPRQISNIMRQDKTIVHQHKTV